MAVIYHILRNVFGIEKEQNRRVILPVPETIIRPYDIYILCLLYMI